MCRNPAIPAEIGGETVDALEAFDLQLIAAGHCTGWRALGQLAQRFGDRVVASAVGKRFVL